MNQSDRIRMIIDDNKLKQKEFAASLGVTAVSYTHLSLSCPHPVIPAPAVSDYIHYTT